METIQHIIIDNTLKRIGEPLFSDYLCHAYCHEGYCTFQRNGQAFRFEAGDCMIIARRGDLVMNLKESEEFRVDVIYVTQKFIELSTPQSNYGMRGQLFLFQNPIMKLTPVQQEICRLNFKAVKRRLKQTDHHFRHDALMNAVECMIIDFHSKLYPADKIKRSACSVLVIATESVLEISVFMPPSKSTAFTSFSASSRPLMPSNSSRVKSCPSPWLVPKRYDFC